MGDFSAMASRASWISAIAIILVVGAGLRFAYIVEQSLWHDEICTLAFVRGVDPYTFEGSDLSPVEKIKPAATYVNTLAGEGFWSQIGRNVIHEGHPPLYYVALLGWCSLAGDSPLSLRSFSAVCSLLTIVVVFGLVRSMAGNSVGVVAAALLAVSPYQVYYAIEARSYALEMCLVAVMIGVALVATRSKRPRRWVIVVGVGAAVTAALTHYYAVLFATSALIAFWRYIDVKTRKAAILPMAIGCGVLLTWTPILVLQISTQEGSHWTEGWPGLLTALGGVGSSVIEILTGPFGSASAIEKVLVALLVVAVCLLGWRKCSEQDRQAIASLVLLCVVFEALVICVDAITNHHTVLISRYAAVIHIPMVIAIAIATRSVGRVGRVLITLVILQGLLASVLTARGHRAPKQALGDVGYYVSSNADSEDVVIVVPSGPTLLGVCMYSDPALSIGAVPAEEVAEEVQRHLGNSRNIWVILQRLGDPYVEVRESEDAEDSWHSNGALVRFVGVDVWYVRHDQK